MSERLTKQQLKEDPLMRQTAAVADYASHHARLLIGAGLAAVILVLGVVFVRAGSGRADDRAAGKLTEAWSDYSRGALEPAAALSEEILREAGGTKVGKRTLLLLGDIRYDQGNYAQAEENYRRAVKTFASDPILGMAARRGLAATLENLSRFDEAAQVYEELAATNANAAAAAELRLDVGRNLLRAGKNEEASAVFEALSKNIDNPQVAQSARVRLAEIENVGGPSADG
jgi:tetratricopeptide (TPR) repeat protein